MNKEENEIQGFVNYNIRLRKVVGMVSGGAGKTI